MSTSNRFPNPPQRLDFTRAPAAIAADLGRRLKRARRTIGEALEESQVDPIPLLELIHEDIDRRFAPLRHRNAVVATPEVREAYEQTLAAITDFDTWLGQNQVLYARFRSIGDAPCFPERPQEEKALVEHALTGFHLAGADLPDAEREHVRGLLSELSELGNRFEMQLLDATDAWHLDLEEARLLKGLPDDVIALLAERAAAAGVHGYRLTLDPAVVDSVLTHASRRALRQQVYEAWVSRASDVGPLPAHYDNAPIIESILARRNSLARAIGYPTYAAYGMAERMVPGPHQAQAFLRDLARRALPRAREELVELAEFAHRAGAKEELAPWDMGYWGERLRKDRYGFDEERLRRYLPLRHVLKGLRRLLKRLYGLRVETRRANHLWHPDVETWVLHDASGEPLGSLYLDLYARPGKRGGAWMDEGGHRLRLASVERRPTAFLSANFLQPPGGRTALIGHDDLITLCHELGHCLHHLLTRVAYPSVGGISGVEWDAVEFPSQLHEEFAWHPAGLALLAADAKTGDPLPSDLVEALGASRRFHGAMRLVRQLEFGLFDMELHCLEAQTPSIDDVRRVLTSVRREVRVTPVSPLDRTECGFAHIFGGGYAAGYYSYLWAEVMARDGFAAFVGADGLDRSAGRRLAETVLAGGGSRPARELYRAFRGHDPDPAPLLSTYGIE